MKIALNRKFKRHRYKNEGFSVPRVRSESATLPLFQHSKHEAGKGIRHTKEGQ